MSHERLQQAARLARAGKRDEAYEIVADVLREEPGSAQAWAAMSHLVDDQTQAAECLKRVIKLADDEQTRRWAADRLAKLEPAPAPMPEPMRAPEPEPVRAPEPMPEPAPRAVQTPTAVSPATERLQRDGITPEDVERIEAGKQRRETREGPRWVVPCAVVAAVLLIGVIACVVASRVGLNRLLTSLTGRSSTVELVEGERYWVGAMQPPLPFMEGLSVPYATLLNEPGEVTAADPTTAFVGMLPDATPVTLKEVQDEWCRVEGTDEWGDQIEGWMQCIQLLDYEPTPVPLPDLTPEQP
jgi:hypothetical protein